MKKKNKGSDNNAGKKVSKITLGVNQDIEIINNLHGRLKKCAVKQVDVNLDAHKVKTIDTATLQLLSSFVRQVQKNGNTVNWQTPTVELVNSAGQIGMQQALLLDEATAGS